MPKPYSPQDHYFHLAKKRGFRARSAFKLEEILTKFPNLFPQNATVLDLGAAPGSFLQVLEQLLQKQGNLMGVDLQKIDPLAPKTQLVQGDVFGEEVEDLIQQWLHSEDGKSQIDLITADLAPKTSGMRDVDQWKSVELNQQVLALAARFLRSGGNLITKIFVGEDFQEFWMEEFKPLFQKSRTYKPKACRDRSFETYLIGQGFKREN